MFQGAAGTEIGAASPEARVSRGPQAGRTSRSAMVVRCLVDVGRRTPPPGALDGPEPRHSAPGPARTLTSGRHARLAGLAQASASAHDVIISGVMSKRPAKASHTRPSATIPERILLFCVASDTDWEHAGITGATVTAMVIRGLIERDTAGHLHLTKEGRRC